MGHHRRVRRHAVRDPRDARLLEPGRGCRAYAPDPAESVMSLRWVGPRIVVGASVLLVAIATQDAVHAQADAGGRLSSPVSFSGEIGSLGELYTVSGRERRRPSSTGRL